MVDGSPFFLSSAFFSNFFEISLAFFWDRINSVHPSEMDEIVNDHVLTTSTSG